MRIAGLLVMVLAGAACGSRAAHGPAWPKTADKESDGGESLAPRAATAVAVVDEEEVVVDEEEAAPEAAAPEPPAATSAASTPPGTPAVTAPEETITVEEIVIEIDE